MIAGSGASVVGFQELEDPQYDRMLSLSGWQAYPGRTLDRGSIRNSLAWDPDVWSLVEARSIGIPYFGGQIIRRPVVRLENIESGREVWFFNTHNPATTPRWGNNARWRAAAISLEIQLANELGADGTPVVFTGDFNDRAEALCPLVGGTDLAAANGGSADGGCAPPARMDVDWVFGSGIEWSDFASVSSGVVGRVSDHPYVSATAYIPEEPIPGTTSTPSDDATASEDATTD
nr:endonuclease/exonuclease/phosphatase family protein [Nocardioides flavescens]